MKFIKDYILSISIIVAGLLTVVLIWNNFGLDTLQKLFSIVGSLSLGVALLTYYYKKKQDETLAVINQITFFREKIIPEALKVEKLILSKDSRYGFPRIEINGASIDEIRKDFSVNFEHQLKIFFDSTKENPSEWEDIEIRNTQTDLLNLLEEFSLKVSNFDIDKNLVLGSIYFAFIQIVEKYAVALFFVRDIQTGDNSIYAATLSLYHSWKPKTQKTDSLKNMHKYGLITKQQKEAIHKRKRESIEKIKKLHSK